MEQFCGTGGILMKTRTDIVSDFYNQGIVDVSYKYEKMYVIRPQFFIPMIAGTASWSMPSP